MKKTLIIIALLAFSSSLFAQPKDTIDEKSAYYVLLTLCIKDAQILASSLDQTMGIKNVRDSLFSLITSDDPSKNRPTSQLKLIGIMQAICKTDSILCLALEDDIESINSYTKIVDEISINGSKYWDAEVTLAVLDNRKSMMQAGKKCEALLQEIKEERVNLKSNLSWEQ
jgi:hypothetical protein